MTSQETRRTVRLKQACAALRHLPGVLHLVWSASASLTVIMVGMSLVRGAIPALLALILKMFIDAVVAGIHLHTSSPLWLPLGLLLAVSIPERLLETGGKLAQQLLQERIVMYVHVLIFEKANKLDLSYFEQPEFYNTLQRVSGESIYRPAMIVSQTFDVLRTLITLCLMSAILWQLTWWITLLMLILPLPSFLIQAHYGWTSYLRAWRHSPERRRQIYYHQLLTFDQFNKEIKLFDLGSFFVQQYRQLVEKLYRETRQELGRHTVIDWIWSLFVIVVNVAVYLYIALQAVAQSITLGGLTLYIQSTTQVRQSFQGLLDGLAQLYEGTLYMHLLFEFLCYQPAIVSPSHPCLPASVQGEQGLQIEFRHVSFVYPGAGEPAPSALKDVSFTIQAGEVVAFVGYNGAGKTTLVKLLTRLYDPDEGEILIGGHNIKAYDLSELRALISAIFQDYVCYNMSVRENIGIGCLAEIQNRQRVVLAASQSGAQTLIDRLPDGYETMLGKWFDEGTQLSGGEWQKIALARAFMRNAPVLVLDEPTSALDALAEYDIFARFRRLAEGKTTIFISHRFSTVRLADRIFVLEQGRILENGTHEELIMRKGRYAELFHLQASAYQ
jgi:ATP-binding cassette subfamily B protein